MGDGVVIETATLHDMAFIMTSAKTEGWNPGLSDATPFYFFDTNGFFVEKLNGEPIGCISAVRYDATYGFLGLYIVQPKYRKQGYGIKLWNRALEHLENRSIGLDGVVEQQHNYAKSGFTFFYNNLRFGGEVKGIRSNTLTPIEEIPFQALVEFDTMVCSINRQQFLQHWITMPNAYSLAKIKDGQVAAYGVVRKCIMGYKIGPLFADDAATADELFRALNTYCDGSPVFIDVVQTNKTALDLVASYNLKQVFETARMYRGIPPKQHLSHVFGITNLEVG